jgi:hypothetical protein
VTVDTAAPDTALAMPDGWHEQADYESGVSYARGYTDGYAAAEQAIAAEIAAAVGVAPLNARDVIKWLIRDFDQPARRQASDQGAMAA